MFKRVKFSSGEILPDTWQDGFASPSANDIVSAGGQEGVAGVRYYEDDLQTPHFFPAGTVLTFVAVLASNLAQDPPVLSVTFSATADYASVYTGPLLTNTAAALAAVAGTSDPVLLSGQYRAVLPGNPVPVLSDRFPLYIQSSIGGTAIVYPAAAAIVTADPATGTTGQKLVKLAPGSPFVAQWVVDSGGGSATTDASLLTSGTLDPARMALGFYRDLAGVATDAVNDALTGKMPGNTAQAIFSTRNDTTSSYVRSATSFPAAGGYDLTGVSVWNNSGQPLYTATALSPRHVLLANHFYPANGTAFRFVTATGEVVTRTLTNSVRIGLTDLQIGVLASDLPATIAYYSVLPMGVLSRLDGAAILFLDQSFLAYIGDIDAASAVSLIAFHQSSDSARSGWWKSGNVLSGDSSHPIFLLADGRAILQGVIQGHGMVNAIGHSISSEIAAVNAAMTTLGGGYQLDVFNGGTPLPDDTAALVGPVAFPAQTQPELPDSGETLYSNSGGKLVSVNAAGDALGFFRLGTTQVSFNTVDASQWAPTELTLSANQSISVDNLSEGQSVDLVIINPGNYTATFTGVEWGAAGAPVVATNGRTFLTFTQVNGTTYGAMLSKAGTSGGVTSFDGNTGAITKAQVAGALAGQDINPATSKTGSGTSATFTGQVGGFAGLWLGNSANAPTGGNYTFLYYPGAGAYLNTPVAEEAIMLRTGNADRMTVSAAGATLYGNLTASGNATVGGVIKPGSYTISGGLPDPTTTANTGGDITVTDASTGITRCFSNGTNWIDVQTGQPVT